MPLAGRSGKSPDGAVPLQQGLYLYKGFGLGVFYGFLFWWHLGWRGYEFSVGLAAFEFGEGIKGHAFDCSKGAGFFTGGVLFVFADSPAGAQIATDSHHFFIRVGDGRKVVMINVEKLLAHTAIGTGHLAQPAPGAKLGVQNATPLLVEDKGVCGAHMGAGGFDALAAHDRDAHRIGFDDLDSGRKLLPLFYGFFGRDAVVRGNAGKLALFTALALGSIDKNNVIFIWRIHYSQHDHKPRTD